MPSHFDCSHLDSRYLEMPISSINLIVSFYPQSNCDERSDLMVPILPPGTDIQLPQPPKANHFAFTFGFGRDTDQVILDVIPSPTQCFSPRRTSQPQEASRYVPATVRVRNIWKRRVAQMSGCIYKNRDIRRGIKLKDILDLMTSKNREQYAFVPRNRQLCGCRHWIRVFSNDMEDAGIVGNTFSLDVYNLMGRYYVLGREGLVEDVVGERVGEVGLGRFYLRMRRGFIKFI